MTGEVQPNFSRGRQEKSFIALTGTFVHTNV